MNCNDEIFRGPTPKVNLESTYEQCLAHELKLNGIALSVSSCNAASCSSCPSWFKLSFFQPPASLKNAKDAKKTTNEHLSGRRPTDLFFFVLFVSFVVQAFFFSTASFNFNVTKLKDGIERFVL